MTKGDDFREMDWLALISQKAVKKELRGACGELMSHDPVGEDFLCFCLCFD